MDKERYALKRKNGVPCVLADGKEFALSCHPFEPCLYITDEAGGKTVVHNAFDPDVVLEAFQRGKTVRSATGREYGEAEFCRMVAFAAGKGEITIDDAEKVFGSGAEKKVEATAAPVSEGVFSVPEGVDVIEDDPFYNVLEQYPDSMVDFCLVKSDLPYDGVNSHWAALLRGAQRIITEDGELSFRAGPIRAKRIPPEALFAPAVKIGDGLNYRTAFLRPPYPVGYTDDDFDRLNGALFPQGQKDLDVYQWTTDWSDYFDDGREWWGTLCLTVYDKAMDRYAVILASATD